MADEAEGVGLSEIVLEKAVKVVYRYRFDGELSRRAFREVHVAVLLYGLGLVLVQAQSEDCASVEERNSNQDVTAHIHLPHPSSGSRSSSSQRSSSYAELVLVAVGRHVNPLVRLERTR